MPRLMSGSDSSSRLRIAIVGPAHPLRGGIADFNHALAQSLTKAGHSVSLFSFYMQYPSILFPGKSQVTEGKGPHGLDIHSTLSSVNPFSWFSTARKISATMPDLVIVRYWMPFMAPALGTLARKLRKQGIPVLAITDNVLPHEKRPGDSMLTRYFVKSCDGFIAMSRSVLEDLSAFTDTTNKLFLPHPLYDTFGEAVGKSDARHRLGYFDTDSLILFFGFIRRYKGLDLLLEALAAPRLKERNVKLLVAGEFYEDEKPYREMVRRLGLSDQVRFDSEFIPQEKIKDYFCAADIVVQPYRSATQSGITQIAYHFGRPMLVTRVGGLAEIVDHDKSGYVVPADPTSIATALDDFYQHARERDMASEVEKAKIRFSWNTFIESLIRFHATIKK